MTENVPPSRRRQAARSPGFTLLEILIVLVIIGIGAGMAEWSLGDRSEMAALRQEAENMGALLTFASDYGLVHQQALGLLVDDSDYELMAYNGQDQRWQALGDAGDKAALGGNIRLILENQADLPPLPLAPGAQQPAVLVDTDGTISPASIVLQWRDAPALQVRLKVGADGSVDITSGDGGSDDGS